MNFQDPNNWTERLAQDARRLGESRMIRDEQPLTPELIAQVFARLKDLLDRLGKSQGWAAKSMGIGETVLSQIVGGTYPADSEKHIRAIDKWIEQQERKERAPKPAGFVKTKVAEQMYGIARWIQQIGAIGLIHGPAGCGKTITLQAIRAETPGSIYLSVKTSGIRKRALLSSLATACRLPGMQITADRVFDQLEIVLKDTGRLIIIDEIHKLAGRASDEALHVLRDLHDATGCPMLWAGQSNINSYLKRGKINYEPLDQVDSRIKFRLDITAMVNQEDGGDGLFSIEDIQKWIGKQGIRITPDAARYIQMIANTPGMGALRTCDGLLRVAVAMSREEKAIDAAQLRKILQTQHGVRFVEAFETANQIDQQKRATA